MVCIPRAQKWRFQEILMIGGDDLPELTLYLNFYITSAGPATVHQLAIESHNSLPVICYRHNVQPQTYACCNTPLLLLVPQMARRPRHEPLQQGRNRAKGPRRQPGAASLFNIHNVATQHHVL